MKEKLLYLFGLGLFIVSAIWISSFDFLLFHTVIEIFGMMMVLSLFILILFSVKMKSSRVDVIIACGAFASGLVIILHTLLYDGMDIVPNFGVNEATQFWIISNIILSGSLLVGVMSENFQINIKPILIGGPIVTVLLIGMVFTGYFPTCYIVGSGITIFKILMEFFIVLIYIATGIIFSISKDNYSKEFYLDFIFVLVILSFSGLVFTLYTSTSDHLMVLGHLLHFSALYVLFVAMGKEFVTTPLKSHLISLSDETTSLKADFIELQKNEGIFKALYNDAPLGYQSLDENGNFIIVNDTYAKMLGYKKSEMIGKFFGDFMSDESNLTVIESFTVFKSRGSVDVIFDMKHASGYTIPVRFMGKIAYKSDGDFKQTHCILMDISNEVEYQKGIIENKKKLVDIIEMTSEGVITLNAKNICVSINDKGLKMLGFTDQRELIGKDFNSLFSYHFGDGNTNIKKESPLSKVFLYGENINDVEIYVSSTEGTWKELTFSAFPNYSLGTIVGATITFRDKEINSNVIESLVRMSYHDPLTGVFNRRYFEEEIKNIDNQQNYPLSIIVADINGLKLMNDAFGHYSGDELLINATKVFVNHSKKDDFIARIGGDEFIIVMPKTTLVEAENRVKDMGKTCSTIQIKSIPLSISFGVETKNSETVSFDDTYKSAEDLMYRMKLLEVPSMRSRTIETIVSTLYEKDPYSEVHSRNVSRISEIIAKKANLSYSAINEIRTTSLLHDIGKIIISKAILTKKGTLTVSEMDEIKKHPEIGFRILNSTNELRDLSNIILCHHEKWDGTGYPRGIKSKEIPLHSRIISIADAYEAMTSDRTYRKKISPQEALQEIIRCSGTQFDPDLVKIFTENFDSITKSLLL